MVVAFRVLLGIRKEFPVHVPCRCLMIFKGATKVQLYFLRRCFQFRVDTVVVLVVDRERKLAKTIPHSPVYYSLPCWFMRIPNEPVW